MPITLPTSTTPTTGNYNMLNDGANIYWLYHKPSFPGVEPLLYDDIISKANNSIDVWDPYFHAATDPIIFSNVQNNVTIRILSRKGLTAVGLTYMPNVRNAIQGIIPVSKNVSFCIGVIDTSTKGDWDFHDRFLIIDTSEVYLIGASVENNHTAKKTSGIYKVQNTTTGSFIMAQFNNHWTQTTRHPSSVQLLHP